MFSFERGIPDDFLESKCFEEEEVSNHQALGPPCHRDKNDVRTLTPLASGDHRAYHSATAGLSDPSLKQT